MGLLPLTYSRPAYVSSSDFRQSQSSLEAPTKDPGTSVRSGKSRVASGIPDALTFEKIIKNEACSVSLPRQPFTPTEPH